MQETKALKAFRGTTLFDIYKKYPLKLQRQKILTLFPDNGGNARPGLLSNFY